MRTYYLNCSASRLGGTIQLSYEDILFLNCSASRLGGTIQLSYEDILFLNCSASRLGGTIQLSYEDILFFKQLRIPSARYYPVADPVIPRGGILRGAMGANLVSSYPTTNVTFFQPRRLGYVPVSLREHNPAECGGSPPDFPC
jgi:hypothetical protein